LFFHSACGARLTDVDDRHYLDFCMAFGPMILGHAHPAVLEAVSGALAKGWSFGAPERASLELAELITGRIDWIDSIRFVNSGTEAVMTALRLARAATDRPMVLKFDGCYHGHVDAMLIRAGSGLAGMAKPDSAGITESVSHDTLIASLDDMTGLEAIFDTHGADIAAAIIEPVPANNGLLPQTPEFINRLASLCRKHGTLLIFDEVITGFRLGFEGYAGQSDIKPDIVTWGKIIGGGFPVGAVAAKQEIMDQLAPLGSVYQAGTLSANPVAMTAGLATLRELLDGDVYARLEMLGRRIDETVGGIDGVALQRCGSIFWLRPPGDTPTCRAKDQIPTGIESWYPDRFHSLLAAGIYLPPSPFEVAFLSAAHDSTHIEELGEALKKS
jgi:glutamate-1-semialdehyde 2,1-aminomutase